MLLAMQPGGTNQKETPSATINDRLASGNAMTALRGSHLLEFLPKLGLSLLVSLLFRRLRLRRSHQRRVRHYQGDLWRTFAGLPRESSRFDDRGLFSSSETSAELSRDLELEEFEEVLCFRLSAGPRLCCRLSFLSRPKLLLLSLRGGRRPSDDEDGLRDGGCLRLAPPVSLDLRSSSGDGLRLASRPGLRAGLRLMLLEYRDEPDDDDLDRLERRPRVRDRLRDGEYRRRLAGGDGDREGDPRRR